jgi:hypothetical protein
MAMRAPDRRREPSEVLGQLLRAKNGFVPQWTAAEGDPARAVLHAYATMLSLLWERVDRASEKNKLQFLADLGIDSLPPAAARAPVIIEPLGGNARAPQGSLVAATSADGRPLTFRTEFGIGLSASPLAEVWSVVPHRDATTSHSAEVTGGRRIRLFVDDQPVERVLYVGHPTLLALVGRASVELEIELLERSTVKLDITWSTWDGTRWREFAPGAVVDRTRGLTERGTIRISTDGLRAARTKVNGVESYWLRGALKTRLTPAPLRRLPVINRLRLRVSVDTNPPGGSGPPPAGQPIPGQVPDALVAAGVERDPMEPVEPFGSQPRPTTLFHAAWNELLSRSGAKVSLTLEVVRSLPTVTTPPPVLNNATLVWEFWNGERWEPVSSHTSPNLDATGVVQLTFTVDPTLAATEVNGREGRWIRARITGGDYDLVQQLVIGSQQIEVRTAYPPRLNALAMSVDSQSRPEFAEHLLAQDGWAFRDGSSAVRFGGTGFRPFLDNADVTPSVYLGFDGPLPSDAIGLYVEVEPSGGNSGHEFRWERFDGQDWIPLAVEDETAHLTQTGIVRLLWPGNRALRRIEPVAATRSTVTTLSSAAAQLFVEGEQVHLKEGETNELAVVSAIDGRSILLRRPLESSFKNGSLSDPEPALFGTPRTWVRARLAEGDAPEITIQRLLLNAVWASDSATIEREVLGSGTNLPGQQFQSARTPILSGEVVEVRELSGARARTDLPILERELASAGRTDALEVEFNAEGDPSAVWVTWRPVVNLRSSGPDDRHYVVDRAQGLLTFGDGTRGRPVPTGANNVRLRRYTTGGGIAGNVPADTIATPLSGIIAKRVWNPVAATGGADAEPTARAARRAPRVLRHRYQAVTVEDYRDVALEASPEVFDASVIRVPDDLGGGLRLSVLPRSDASPPAPSAQLLATVRRHVLRRCAAGAATRLRVMAPVFIDVGLEVELAPTSFDTAGQAFDQGRAVATDFLHAVRGGPSGAGWPFGSVVHVARLAPALEAIEGVDFVTSLVVTARGAIVGDALHLAPEELPSPGSIRIRLATGRGA